MDFIEGEILYVTKPLDWTSFRLVKVIRAKLCNRLGIKKLKVGHAGTLDPLATGVMIVCTGKKTKQIERLQATVKEYTATLKLGATTPSFDLETEIDAEYPTEHITEEVVRECLDKFVGEIQQIPPNFSAVNDEVFELKPKLLVIDKIDLINYELPYLTISITCSKGTYIRALARDIGESLNSGAHLTALVRTRVGEATLDECMHIDDLDDFFDKNI